MTTTNPYEAPRSDQAALSERKFASRLLALRDSGVTLGTLYRMQVKAIVFLFLILGAGIGYFAWFDILPGVYLMSGLLAGTLLRDLGLMRLQVKMWPMQNQVLDWRKVERMAKGEDPDR